MAINKTGLLYSDYDPDADSRIRKKLLEQAQRYTPGQSELPYVYWGGRGYTLSTLDKPTVQTPLTSWPATPNMTFKQGYKLRRRKRQLYSNGSHQITE